MSKAKTLYEKIYDAHVVVAAPGETPILYIDRHLVQEVTSPQAFDGLREKVARYAQLAKLFRPWITTSPPLLKTSIPQVKWRASRCKRFPKLRRVWRHAVRH